MKKIICFDLDGVICKTFKNKYNNSKPNKVAIDLINKLYNKGFVIKIFTSRHMTKFKGNINKVKRYGYIKTKSQLNAWGLKYHKLIMGKPSYDIYIDDKSIDFKKNWEKILKKKLKIK